MSATLLLASASAASTIASATVTTASVAATSVPETGTLESIVTTVVPSIVASALPSTITTTVPVTAQPIFLPVPFEVAAIFAGALAGAMIAVNRRFDITGLVVLAMVNGLGGGILRDLLLQDYGIFALENPRALFAVLAASIVGAFFFKVAEKIRPVLVPLDALSLGLFALVGADKALVAGLSPMPAILLGTITAIGGGIMRDLLCDREPQIMRRGSLFAIAAVTASALFVTMITWLNITKPAAMAVAATLAVVLRLGSLWLGWESPEPVDLTDAMRRIPRSILRGGSSMFRRTSRTETDDAGAPAVHESDNDTEAK